MKTIAICEANLDRTPLGTRSRLTESLDGVPILRATLERLAAVEGLSARIVSAPAAQTPRIAELLDGLPVEVVARTTGEPAYRSLIRTARKWSLDAWRGGLGGSCAFDEYLDVQHMAALVAKYEADAALTLPPGAALIDPAFCTDMLAHAEKHIDSVRLTFAQAPPGLAPTIFQAPLCGQLASANAPPGWSIAYQPDDPQVDLAHKPACMPVAQAIRYAAGRITADTERSLNTMRAIVAGGVTDGAAGSAEAVATWLLDHEHAPTAPLPREVEIELTTEDRLGGTCLRPRGERVPQRGPLRIDYVDKLAAELGAVDDSLVVLGGHGDPVLHPEFAACVRSLRSGSVYGLAVTTTGQDLSDAALSALVEHRVDVVVFQLDAWTDATYAHLTGGASLQKATATIDRLLQAREAAGQAQPIVVPQFTKCRENVEEMDAFYDGWLRRQGCASIVGSSHFSGRLTDRSCVDMRPPARIPCRRLMSRSMVLADGTVSACDQDFRGETVLGHLGEATLREVWHGAEADRLRRQHATGELGNLAVCAPCAEWHRP